jgi:hypothetical protein
MSSYCNRLEAVARDPKAQAELHEWVNRNVVGQPIAASEVLAGDRIAPGFRWLAREFDAKRFGFGPKAHVRLVGPEAQDVLDDAVAESVESVLFTEQSRTGILVRLPSSSTFGLDHTQFKEVSEDIAVVCYTRD